MVLDHLTNPDWSVLEIGPGGHPTRWAGPYTSIDLTEPGKHGIFGSEAGVICTAEYQADMAALPFPDDHFDALIARHVVEHSADTICVLQEWRRVLKPGGVMLIVTPDQETHPGNTIKLDPTHKAAFTRDQLAFLASRSGFSDVTTRVCIQNWSFFLKAFAYHL